MPSRFRPPTRVSVRGISAIGMPTEEVREGWSFVCICIIVSNVRRLLGSKRPFRFVALLQKIIRKPWSGIIGEMMSNSLFF